jgi:hypothetical protein
MAGPIERPVSQLKRPVAQEAISGAIQAAKTVDGFLLKTFSPLREKNSEKRRQVFYAKNKDRIDVQLIGLSAGIATGEALLAQSNDSPDTQVQTKVDSLQERRRIILRVVPNARVEEDIQDTIKIREIATQMLVAETATSPKDVPANLDQIKARKKPVRIGRNWQRLAAGMVGAGAIAAPFLPGVSSVHGAELDRSEVVAAAHKAAPKENPEPLQQANPVKKGENIKVDIRVPGPAAHKLARGAKGVVSAAEKFIKDVQVATGVSTPKIDKLASSAQGALDAVLKTDPSRVDYIVLADVTPSQVDDSVRAMRLAEAPLRTGVTGARLALPFSQTYVDHAAGWLDYWKSEVEATSAATRTMVPIQGDREIKVDVKIPGNEARKLASASKRLLGPIGDFAQSIRSNIGISRPDLTDLGSAADRYLSSIERTSPALGDFEIKTNITPAQVDQILVGLRASETVLNQGLPGLQSSVPIVEVGINNAITWLNYGSSQIDAQNALVAQRPVPQVGGLGPGPSVAEPQEPARKRSPATSAATPLEQAQQKLQQIREAGKQQNHKLEVAKRNNAPKAEIEKLEAQLKAAQKAEDGAKEAVVKLKQEEQKKAQKEEFVKKLLANDDLWEKYTFDNPDIRMKQILGGDKRSSLRGKLNYLIAVKLRGKLGLLDADLSPWNGKLFEAVEKYRKDGKTAAEYESIYSLLREAVSKKTAKEVQKRNPIKTITHDGQQMTLISHKKDDRKTYIMLPKDKAMNLIIEQGLRNSGN